MPTIICSVLVSCARLLKIKESGKTVYKKTGAAGMLLAPIISLAFDLRHQVVVSTLHFTDFDVFDKKMDAVIETAVQNWVIKK